MPRPTIPVGPRRPTPIPTTAPASRPSVEAVLIVRATFRMADNGVHDIVTCINEALDRLRELGSVERADLEVPATTIDMKHSL